MTNTSEWRMNTGTVPEGVDPDTMIEVEYRDGRAIEWVAGGVPNDDIGLWAIDGWKSDIIRWRFV